MDPLLYHAHHSRNQTDIPFWLDLATRQGDSILELGCGTGRVLMPLAKAGYRVYGLDNDTDMLLFLQHALPAELRPAVHLIQADMTHFRLEPRFRAIFVPCNTLSTLPPEDLRETLRLVYQHLEPGGLFAASIPNPAVLEELPSESDSEVEDLFPHPGDRSPVQVSSSWRKIESKMIFNWHYDHLLPDGHVQRSSAEVSHYLTPVGTYLELISETGFHRVDIYGDFDCKPYTSGSPHLILVTTK